MVIAFVVSLTALVAIVVALGVLLSRAYRTACDQLVEVQRLADAGDEDAALAAARTAYEVTNRLPPWDRERRQELRDAAALLLAAHLIQLGYSREALRRLEEIEVPGLPDRSRDAQVALLITKSSGLAGIGAFGDAAAYSGTALRVVRESPVLRKAEGEHRDLVIAVLEAHAMHLYYLGAIDDALALNDEVAAMLRATQSDAVPQPDATLCRILADRALILFMAGYGVDAERVAVEAVKLGRDAEPTAINRQHLTLAMYMLAGSLIQLGRAAEAVPVAAESVVLARANANGRPFPRQLLAACLTLHAHALHRVGRTEEAVGLIGESEPVQREAAAAEPALHEDEMAFVLVVKAEIAAAQGRVGDARQLCEEIDEILRRCAAGRADRFRYAFSLLDELRTKLAG